MNMQKNYSMRKRLTACFTVADHGFQSDIKIIAVRGMDASIPLLHAISLLYAKGWRIFL